VLFADLDTTTRLRLQALLLADSIYQDRGSGKYVIAGTFHSVNVAGFPSLLGRSVGVFIALVGHTDEAELEISLIEASTETVLLRSGPLTIPAGHGDDPLELAVELPSLPLPRPGRYLIRVAVGGATVGVASFTAREMHA
jgi:hypothetical protein